MNVLDHNYPFLDVVVELEQIMFAYNPEEELDLLKLN